VVTSLIRWIGQISAIGRVGYTISAVEKAARDAINVMEEFPYLGGQRLDWEPEGEPIPAPISGYVQHCDMPGLQRLAEEHDLKISVIARPGAYATPVKPLVQVEGKLTDEIREDISDCFVLGESRTYDSDPRFGMIVLGEI